MASLALLSLVAGTLSFALLASSVLWSIAKPAQRIWPPPEGVRWKVLFTRILTNTGQASLVLAGLTDWGSLDLENWIRLGIGGTLFLGGGTLALAGVHFLGWRNTYGTREGFVSSGPYRVTRNPQYVGAILSFGGFAVACASGYAAFISAVATVYFLLLPLCEEPWMRSQYGAAFELYSRQVRRYL